MCTRQPRKVIWDMINTLFVKTVAVQPILLLSISTREHMSVASRAILSNFFGEQGRQNHPQYLWGLSRALFPTTFLETAVHGKQLMSTWSGKRVLNYQFILWFLTGLCSNVSLLCQPDGLVLFQEKYSRKYRCISEMHVRYFYR